VLLVGSATKKIYRSEVRRKQRRKDLQRCCGCRGLQLCSGCSSAVGCSSAAVEWVQRGCQTHMNALPLLYNGFVKMPLPCVCVRVVGMSRWEWLVEDGCYQHE
jgi:hypothetical protein